MRNVGLVSVTIVGKAPRVAVALEVRRRAREARVKVADVDRAGVKVLRVVGPASATQEDEASCLPASAGRERPPRPRAKERLHPPRLRLRRANRAGNHQNPS